MNTTSIPLSANAASRLEDFSYFTLRESTGYTLPPESLVREEKTDTPAGAASHDPEQWWFWTEEWQNGEREADADIREGRTRHIGTDEEFLRGLGG